MDIYKERRLLEESGSGESDAHSLRQILDSSEEEPTDARKLEKHIESPREPRRCASCLQLKVKLELLKTLRLVVNDHRKRVQERASITTHLGAQRQYARRLIRLVVTMLGALLKAKSEKVNGGLAPQYIMMLAAAGIVDCSNGRCSKRTSGRACSVSRDNRLLQKSVYSMLARARTNQSSRRSGRADGGTIAPTKLPQTLQRRGFSNLVC